MHLAILRCCSVGEERYIPEPAHREVNSQLFNERVKGGRYVALQIPYIYLKASSRPFQ